MKKIITPIMILVVLIFMSGCGGGDASSSGSIKLPSVEKQVIYDENNVKVTVNAGEIEEGLSNVEIPITIENKSNKSVKVNAKQLRINGVTIWHFYTSFGGCIVDANSTSTNAKFGISPNILKISKIKEVGDIEFDLDIKFSGEDPIIKENVKIVTSLSGKVKQEFKASGKTIYDQDGIKLLAKETLDSSAHGPMLILYFVNNSDKFVSVANPKGFVANGKQVSGGFQFGLKPSSKMVCNAIIGENDIKAAGVKLPIKSLAFKVVTFDNPLYGKKVLPPAEVKLEF